MQLDDLKQQASKMEQSLNNQRDELKRKSGEFNADVKKQWEALEKKHEQFTAKLHDAKEHAGDVGDDVYSSIQKMNNEIKDGYNKIKTSIKKH